MNKQNKQNKQGKTKQKKKNGKQRFMKAVTMSLLVIMLLSTFLSAFAFML